MKIINQLLNGYENTKLYHYNELPNDFPGSIYYDEIEKKNVKGVLKASRHVNGRLLQTYSLEENHVGIIAGTRLGKTSSYVIPTLCSFAKSKMKRNLIISDPKGELYHYTAQTLRDNGYKVLLIDFRDYLNSECWNPLTPIYRKYHSMFHVSEEVEVVKTKNGYRNKFRGRIYENQIELDQAIEEVKYLIKEEVGNQIDELTMIINPTADLDDPYWDDSARELLKGYIWALLEDSVEETRNKSFPKITEDTCSIASILRAMEILGGESNFDGGFFTNRSNTSNAKMCVYNVIINNAEKTRNCIISNLNSHISIFRETAIRLITTCNSFETSILYGKEPVAIYINYKDEIKVHHKIISMFIQDAYRVLIDFATNQPNGKLEIPFYFVLDEFGNFPAIKDFETTISACAGRNIFFILVIQSYAQLNAVYGQSVAMIIRDNLNMHVFFGSNNPQTIEEFSSECGEYTRISPLSALNGNSSELDTYQIETIKRVPKSMLTKLQPGECIVTEANSGYVLFSMLERYYLCDEFKNLPLSNVKDYVSLVNPLDKKYSYVISKQKRKFEF